MVPSSMLPMTSCSRPAGKTAGPCSQKTAPRCPVGFHCESQMENSTVGSSSMTSGFQPLGLGAQRIIPRLQRLGRLGLRWRQQQPDMVVQALNLLDQDCVGSLLTSQNQELGYESLTNRRCSPLLMRRGAGLSGTSCNCLIAVFTMRVVMGCPGLMSWKS